jgi:hypothetical protein
MPQSENDRKGQVTNLHHRADRTIHWLVELSAHILGGFIAYLALEQIIRWWQQTIS